MSVGYAIKEVIRSSDVLVVVVVVLTKRGVGGQKIHTSVFTYTLIRYMYTIYMQFSSIDGLFFIPEISDSSQLV